MLVVLELATIAFDVEEVRVLVRDVEEWPLATEIVRVVFGFNVPGGMCTWVGESFVVVVVTVVIFLCCY